MGFESYHPAIALIWSVGTIAATVLFKQPVFLVIAYLSAFLYSVKRNGWRAVAFGVGLIPFILAFTLYYSSYHHFGVTVLRQNMIGNDMTVESALCGLTIGILVASVVMWLSCVISVFTADKVVYLFGRVSPRLSLFLSILLRLVPRLKARARKIATARKAVGKGIGQGNILQRIANGVKIVSMLVTWLLESMATTSDSMRSRGYGLKGRTAFSIYRFDDRDRSVVIGLFACLTSMLMAYILGWTQIRFDPRVVMAPITPVAHVFYFGFALFCLLPMVLEVWSEQRFRALRSRV
ncbi:MAG: hypothetical protein IJW45_00105 [Oscillospiraceae bacterium]|nr:hypothetical protein [Oscillospiraceae bacterium]